MSQSIQVEVVSSVVHVINHIQYQVWLHCGISHSVIICDVHLLQEEIG